MEKKILTQTCNPGNCTDRFDGENNNITLHASFYIKGVLKDVSHTFISKFCPIHLGDLVTIRHYNSRVLSITKAKDGTKFTGFKVIGGDSDENYTAQTYFGSLLRNKTAVKRKNGEIILLEERTVTYLSLPSSTLKDDDPVFVVSIYNHKRVFRDFVTSMNDFGSL